MSGSETDKLASTSNKNSWAESELDSEVDADCGVVSIGTATILPPYQDEPIVRESAQERNEEDIDIDGISINTLESKFEKRTVNTLIYIIQSCF